MNNTKISCRLALTTIVLFIIWFVLPKSDGSLNSIKHLIWILPLLLVTAISVIAGFIFSIKAIIKERTVLSWICTIIFMMPILFVAVITPATDYFHRAAQYNSPQSQKRREEMYVKYHLPDSLDISVINKTVSINVVNERYPILSVYNYGNGFWFFSSREDDVEIYSRPTSFAEMIELDKSIVPLLTTLPMMHYASRKSVKSPWTIGEFRLSPTANDDE
jgi:hypothetical protein